VLSLPFAFEQSGAVLGSILLIVSGIGYYVSYSALVYACAKFEMYDFYSICSKYYGQFFRRLTEILVIAMCFGALTSYMVLVPKFVTSLLLMFDIIDESKK